MNARNTDEIILGLISRCSTIPGKKIFQKLCYFLQEAEGVRLGARFRMRHYGPYSEELDDCLEDLAERDFVTIEDFGDEGFQIKGGPTLREAPLSDEASNQIEELLSKLEGELHHGLTLELLATAHFLAKRQRYEGTDADKDELTRRVKAWKGKKFQDYFIRQNIERLEQWGYLSPA